MKANEVFFHFHIPEYNLFLEDLPTDAVLTYLSYPFLLREYCAQKWTNRNIYIYIQLIVGEGNVAGGMKAKYIIKFEILIREMTTNFIYIYIYIS